MKEETLLLTKEQTEIVMSKIASKKNGVQELMEMVLNSLMRSERTAYLEEVEGGNKANGYRPLSVFGDGRCLELKIPRDRLSEFKPMLLAIYRDRETRYREIAFELYSKGLTTREISSVIKKIYGDNYSKSKISRISRYFYEDLEAWRNRPLEEHYKALFIDGTVVKVLDGRHYRNYCFYVILALRDDNRREIISVVSFPQESSTSWKIALQELRERGLKRVGLVVSDALSGLENVVAQVFPGTPHQLCCVHLMRNLSSYLPRDERKEICSDLKAVIDLDNPKQTEERAMKSYEAFKNKWGTRSRALGKYFDRLDFSPYLTCLRYDYRVRPMLYTTNWIERFNKSAKRTLKIRGAFPDQESVLALITAVAMDLGERTYSYPIYKFIFEEGL